ncbi:MAG: adenylate/guanylate cyclase domain-containing protein [Candidatus Methylomirabilota bacterium]|jgi:adenylate cyclase
MTLRRSVLWGLALGSVVALVHLLGLLESLELKTVNHRFEIRGAEEPRFPIVLVTVDEDSFDNLHLRWPWPRSVHARLLDEIGKGSPRAVAFDILFPEPTKDRPQEDRLLAAAMARRRNVFLAMVIKPMETLSGGVRVTNIRMDRPIPLLRERAVGEGFSNVIPGSDGFVREADIVRMHQDQAVPSLAKALHDRLARDLPAAPIPPETRRILVNFRGPRGTFPTFPYYQVVTGELPSELFRDKIVLVGASALTLQDLHLAPFASAGRLTPGSEILANVLDNLLAGDPLRALPNPLRRFTAGEWYPQNPWYVLPILVVAILATLIADRFRPLRGFLLTAGIWLTFGAACIVAFVWGRFWVEFVPISVALVIPYGVTVLRNFVHEERVRREMARFFSPEIARQIAHDRTGLVIASKRRPITVLFSDIRNFTSISEGLPPEEVVELLREYFNTMVPIVLKHGGTLDKYVGDALMGLFGAPLAQGDHAIRALRAALEMVAQLPLLSPKWEARSGRPLQIGVGVNSGEAVVGVMGADSRREYSAIGDTVNLASRLEGVTKDFKTPIVVSHATVLALGDRFQVRELSEVKVKGRQESVRVYAVDGELAAGSSAANPAASESGHG